LLASAPCTPPRLFQSLALHRSAGVTAEPCPSTPALLLNGVDVEGTLADHTVGGDIG
jgi:hypothetical protein